MIREYVHFLRVKHYIKNLLVFVPLFFGGAMFYRGKMTDALMGFITFSLLSSSIYVFNDYIDIDKDRKHPTKKNRPLASGMIKPQMAIIMMIILLLCVLGMSVLIGNLQGFLLLMLYFLLNIAYSLELKKKPIIDIVILSSGFIIRVFYGGAITGISISKWLYLVIITGSLYMSLGKRRNELRNQTETREVLQYYSESFLDKNMYVSLALANVFYSLWTLEMPNSVITWTIPVFIVILMCYSLDAERDPDGDPVEIILHDRFLICLLVAYAVCLFVLLYH